MAQCVHCSTAVPDDARFCHSCGSQVSDAEGQARASAAIDASALLHIEKMLGEETKGQFEIQGLLGRGGMAVVFLATETGLGRKVAIKVLPPELTFGHGLERFKREAKTSAGLDHPNIIPVYRVGGGGKLFWYAMKFLEGRSLDDLLKEVGKLPLDDSIDILSQVADALDYAHERRVVHRDIKPANVMLDSRNRVIVTDFGIAKALTEGGLTASGSVIGTPYYMSPEQGMGKPVSGASDQYSVGVMAYRMLAGQVPFEGDSSIDILHKHCMTPPEPIETLAPELPGYVGRALDRALDKKPGQRFPNVGTFVKALRGQKVPGVMAEAATVMVSTGQPQSRPGASNPAAATSGARSRTGKKTVDRASTELMSIQDTPSTPLPDRGPKPQPPQKSRTPILVGAGAGGVLVLGLVIGLLAKGASGGGGGAPPPTDPPESRVAPIVTANTAPEPSNPQPSNPNPGAGAPSGRSASNPAGRTQTNTGAAARQSSPPRQVAVVPPRAPAVPREGYLQLAVTGGFANVFVDGVDQGQKSRFLDTLPTGGHLIKLTRDGYNDIDTAITIRAGEAFSLRLTLTPRQ